MSTLDQFNEQLEAEKTAIREARRQAALEAEAAKADALAAMTPAGHIAVEPDEEEPSEEAVQDVQEAGDDIDPADTASETEEPAQGASQEPSKTIEDPEGTEEARIGRLYKEKREMQKERDRLARELEIARGNVVETVDEQTQRLVEAQAREMASKIAFDNEANRIKAAYEKDFGPINTMLEAFKDAFGGTPTELVQAAMIAAPGAEHKLLRHFAKNLDEAERVMKMNPVQLGAAVASIATKVTAPPPPKKVTNASPPLPRVQSGHIEPAPKSRADMTAAELMELKRAKPTRARVF